jgi:hypothetical protein
MVYCPFAFFAQYHRHAESLFNPDQPCDKFFLTGFWHAVTHDARLAARMSGIVRIMLRMVMQLSNCQIRIRYVRRRNGSNLFFQARRIIFSSINFGASSGYHIIITNERQHRIFRRPARLCDKCITDSIFRDA